MARVMVYQEWDSKEALKWKCTNISPASTVMCRAAGYLGTGSLRDSLPAASRLLIRACQEAKAAVGADTACPEGWGVRMDSRGSASRRGGVRGAAAALFECYIDHVMWLYAMLYHHLSLRTSWGAQPTVLLIVSHTLGIKIDWRLGMLSTRQCQ
jgi:hypothetical protein